MTDPREREAREVQARVGLCASCRHVEVVTTSRESRFYLCRRSRVDPRYSKYPPLPVRICPGHEPGDSSLTSG